MPPQLTSSESLILAAVAGDRAALEQLLLAQYDAVLRHVAPEIPQQYRALIDAEDVLQQSFIQAFRDIRKTRLDSSTAFRNWLFTIADHRLADSIKALRRKKRGGDLRRAESPAASGSFDDLLNLISQSGLRPSQIVARKEAVQSLQVALAGLDVDHREVIRLRYLENKTEDEVAACLGKGPDAIRGLCHRAKKKLREALGRSSRYFSIK